MNFLVWLVVVCECTAAYRGPFSRLLQIFRTTLLRKRPVFCTSQVWGHHGHMLKYRTPMFFTMYQSSGINTQQYHNLGCLIMESKIHEGSGNLMTGVTSWTIHSLLFSRYAFTDWYAFTLNWYVVTWLMDETMILAENSLQVSSIFLFVSELRYWPL